MHIKHKHPEFCCRYGSSGHCIRDIVIFQVKKNFFTFCMDFFYYPWTNRGKQLGADFKDINMLSKFFNYFYSLLIISCVKSKDYTFSGFHLIKIKGQNYKRHKVAKAQRRTKTLCLLPFL